MYYYKLFLFRCLVSGRWFRQRLRETTLTETMASAVSHKPVRSGLYLSNFIRGVEVLAIKVDDRANA